MIFRVCVCVWTRDGTSEWRRTWNLLLLLLLLLIGGLESSKGKRMIVGHIASLERDRAGRISTFTWLHVIGLLHTSSFHMRIICVRRFETSIPLLPRPMLKLTQRLQENLQIELQRANRIRQLKLAQHTRMQNAKDTNGVILASKVDSDSRRMAGQKRRICCYQISYLLHKHDVRTVAECNLPLTSSIQ